MPVFLQASISSVPAGTDKALPLTVILTSLGASAMKIHRVPDKPLVGLLGQSLRMLTRREFRVCLDFFHLQGVALGMHRHQRQQLVAVQLARQRMRHDLGAKLFHRDALGKLQSALARQPGSVRAPRTGSRSVLSARTFSGALALRVRSWASATIAASFAGSDEPGRSQLLPCLKHLLLGHRDVLRALQYRPGAGSPAPR